MPFGRNHLRYFVVVADEGQITRAAKKLQIAQPALSHAIARLESQLGVELLERHPRGVTLTAAGEAFLLKARVAVAAHDDVVDTARMLARGQRQTVELGFVLVAAPLHSPGPLKGLAEAHPEIEIRYRDLPFPFTPTRSWLSEVDVAACPLPPADPEVWSRPIRRGGAPRWSSRLQNPAHSGSVEGPKPMNVSSSTSATLSASRPASG